MKYDNGAEAWIASQRPDRMAKIVEKRRHAALTESTAKELVVQAPVPLVWRLTSSCRSLPNHTIRLRKHHPDADRSRHVVAQRNLRQCPLSEDAARR
jgi:hypothetical protein